MSTVLKEQEFHIDNYLTLVTGAKVQDKIIDITKDKNTHFLDICEAIKSYFQKDWETEEGKGGEHYDVILERQKKAIIGYNQEVAFFKDKVEEYIKSNNLQSEWYPCWYRSLTEAIFHENWGVAGLAEWFNSETDVLKGSSSAKIIGERIYFLINGSLILQRQTITINRRKQLLKALLLKTPKKRLEDDQHDLYTLDGTRISIYGEGLSKDGQESFIFRKFTVKDYTFEKQADLETIPLEAIPLFKSMIDIGFNVAFTGPVRTAKTTFLTTWQSYENPLLEGVSIETDPEIPFHLIMPTAPIIQLVADGEKLENITKSVLRSDPDYILMCEARDAVAFYIALEATDRGTKRVKMTAHFSRAVDFPYNVAKKIVEKYGGDLYSTSLKVAQNFNYVFEFVQLKDKSKKRLKGIYELRYNPITHHVSIHHICKYRYKKDDWTWSYDVGADKEVIGEEEDYEAFLIFKSELKRLSELFPMSSNEETVFHPAFSHLGGGSYVSK